MSDAAEMIGQVARDVTVIKTTVLATHEGVIRAHARLDAHDKTIEHHANRLDRHDTLLRRYFITTVCLGTLLGTSLAVIAWMVSRG